MVVVVGDTAAHPVGRPEAGTWPAGTVATLAPPASTPVSVTPAIVGSPGTAITAMPALGAMVSTTVPPLDARTDATPLPVHTATQPTGAPSTVPKEPAPRISTESGDGAAPVGRRTDPVPTARSVDSSTTSCPHVAAGTTGTVPVVPDPGEPLLVPEDPDVLPAPVVVVAVVPADPEPDPVAGVTIGSAHGAPVGHGVGVGSVPTGVQSDPCTQGPVTAATV